MMLVLFIFIYAELVLGFCLPVLMASIRFMDIGLGIRVPGFVCPCCPLRVP
jgi:uncharacterized membrane protein